MHRMTRILSIPLLLSCPLFAQAAPPTVTASGCGLQLQALSAADLDAIASQSGYRVGVLVSGVKQGSAAAQAGLRARDVLLTVGTSGVASPAAVDQALAGSQGSAVVLLMRPGQMGYEMARVTLQLPEVGGTASAAGGAAPGTDDAQAKLAALETLRKAGVLTDAEYRAKREQLLGGSKPATSPTDTAAPDTFTTGKGAPGVPAPASSKGGTFRHPIGFQFWYPAGWRVNTHDEFLELVPPDQARNQYGPTESYLIIGDSVAGEGITGGADPRVGTYLDQRLMGLVPGLRRQGGTTTAL